MTGILWQLQESSYCLKWSWIQLAAQETREDLNVSRNNKRYSSKQYGKDLQEDNDSPCRTEILQ